jgi:hypothetical protein
MDVARHTNMTQGDLDLDNVRGAHPSGGREGGGKGKGGGEGTSDLRFVT